MPDEVNIQKVSIWADSWWKIISILATVAFGIYQLSAVWITVLQTKQELESLKAEIARDNAFRDDRSDKRYNRAIDMYNELKRGEETVEQELENHLIKDAYDKGRIDAKFELRK